MPKSDFPAIKKTNIEDIKYLDGITYINDDVMPLTIMHGFLAAVVSAIDIVKPSQWLPEILEFSPGKKEIDDSFAEEFIPRLMDFYNNIASNLYNGEDFHPIMYDDDKDVVLNEHTASDELLSNWCWGYLRGVEFGGGYPEGFIEYLEPIIKYAEVFDVFGEPDENLTKEEYENLSKDLRKQLPGAVKKVYAKSFEFRDLHETFEPKSKVGRNELCPCGSNKKYKKCCLKEQEVYH